MEMIDTGNRYTYSSRQICDRAAAVMSNETDVPNDRAWLQAHPNAAFRERPASKWEQRMSGFSGNAVVRVFLLPDGGLGRCVIANSGRQQS